MALRETAWRPMSRELIAATEEERGEGERAASYLLSPYGARMNRVVLAGRISAAEAIGRDEPSTFWRARLTDPLGEVTVTAGSFQPRAMVQLRAAPAGRPVVVIGKVHLFRGRDGAGTASVRAEAVRPVPEAEQRAVHAEAVRQTLDRLDLLERIAGEPQVDDDHLRADGHPALWIRAARACLRRYPTVDRTGYRAELVAVVRTVAGTLPAPTDVLPPSVTATVDAPHARASEPSDADRADAATFLDLVDQATEGSNDGYADVRELWGQLEGRGIGPERAEEVLGRLEETGVLHEPIVGKLRRA